MLTIDDLVKGAQGKRYTLDDLMGDLPVGGGNAKQSKTYTFPARTPQAPSKITPNMTDTEFDATWSEMSQSERKASNVAATNSLFAPQPEMTKEQRLNAALKRNIQTLPPPPRANPSMLLGGLEKTVNGTGDTLLATSPMAKGFGFVDAMFNLPAKNVHEQADIRKQIENMKGDRSPEGLRKTVQLQAKAQPRNFIAEAMFKNYQPEASPITLQAQEQKAQATARLKEGKGELGKLAVDLGVGGADMATTYAISKITGLPYLAVQGMLGGAETANQALAEGYSADKALTAGVASGGATAAIESLGGIGGNVGSKIIGKLAASSVGKAALSKAPAAALYLLKASDSVIGKILGSAGAEAIEEFTEYDAQRVLNNLILDKDTPRDVKEQLRNTLIALMLGSAFGGASAYNGVQADKANEQQAVNDYMAQGNAIRREFTGADINPTNPALGDMFIQQARRNVQGKNQEGQVQDSYQPLNVEPYTAKEIVNINTPRIKLMTAVSDFTGFVRGALSGDGSQEKVKMFLGKVGGNLANKISQSTGLDLNGYNLSLSNHEIRKIVKNSHGDAQREALRGQRPVTTSDIENILRVVDDPDNVYRSSYDTASGKPSITFEKQIGDNYVYVQYVSDKHHTLEGQTMWITKRKNPHPASDGISPSTHAQGVQEQGFSLNPTVAQRPQGVNTQSVQPFGENTVGAAQSAFKHQQKTSRVRTNTIERSEMFGQAEKELLDNNIFNYDVVTEKQSMAEARSRLETDFEGEAKELFTKDYFNGADTDTAMGIAERYGKAAIEAGRDSQEAVRYANWVKKLQQKATESGQAVQAFAKYTRTPEAATIKAQSIVSSALDEYAQRDPNGAMVNAYDLTPQDFIDIHTYSKKALEYPDGSYERAMWSAKADKVVGSKLPQTFKKKLTTYLMNSMLGNFRTLISRNAGGNLLFALPETLKQIPAASIDKAISLGTGVRTRTLPSIDKTKAYWQGFGQGLTEAVSDYKNGVRTQSGNEVPDMTQGATSNSIAFSNKNFVGRLANEADRLVGSMLTLGDRPFFQAAYNQRLVELKKIKSMGKLGGVGGEIFSVSNFDKIAPTLAKIDALEATFQNDSAIAKGLSEIKKGLNEFGKATTGIDIVGQFVLPFTNTPANIFQRAVEYTPLGVVKNTVNTGVELKRGTFNQQRFVDETSRNLLGAGVFWAAGALLRAGLITGELDKDKDKREAQYAIGMQPYSVKFGNSYYSYDWIPVIGPSAVAGVAFEEAYQNSEQNPFFAGVGAASTKAIQTSALQGMTRMFGGNDIATSVGQSMLSGTGQFIPSILRQGASISDKYQRESYDPNVIKKQVNYLTTSVPALRNVLHPKIDPLGQPVLQNQGRGVGAKLVENMLSPSKRTDIQSDPLYSEAFRLSGAVGEGGNAAFPTSAEKTYETGGKRKEFSAEEYYQYAVARGELQGAAAKEIIRSHAYRSLSNEEKVTVLSGIYAQAGAIARKEVLGDSYAVPKPYAKAYEAYLKGIPLSTYNEVDAIKDADRNGSVSQEEMKKALDQSGLGVYQRAFLYSLQNKSWKNNPYK